MWTLLDKSLCAPTRNLKVHELHEFAICTSSQGGNEIGKLISKLVQFTGLHFSDLNPNSYGNLSNMKLDLMSPPRSNLVEMTRAFNLKISVITDFLTTG